MVVSISSCKKEQAEDSTNENVTVSGQIQRQSITFYQYGSHIISNDQEVFALRSETIDLETYINKTVIVVGQKVPGYPVDGGPDYLEVIRVK